MYELRNFDTPLDVEGVSQIRVEPSGIAAAGVRMQQAIDHANQDWKERFLSVLDELALSGNPFTSEDITGIVGLTAPGGSPRNNVVGALMSGAAKRGVIHKTGEWVYSQRHGSEIRYWIGNDESQ